MTRDHPLRRALARFCSADTMSRIVDPIFADMRFEDGRATVRGSASLTRALTLHAVMFMRVDERLVKASIASGVSLAGYLAWSPNVVLLLAASALIRVRQSASDVLH